MLLHIPGQRLSRQLKGWVIFIIVVVLATGIGGLKVGMIRSFSLVGGSFFVLFFSGWWTSYIAFPMSDSLGSATGPTSRRTLDIIERCTLAVTFSMIISFMIEFGLYNCPKGNKLMPLNFIVATVLVNILLFTAAAWRKKWISLASVVVLGVFPFVVVALNQVFNMAITTRNFLSAVLVLGGVLIAVRIINKRRSPLAPQ